MHFPHLVQKGCGHFIHLIWGLPCSVKDKVGLRKHPKNKWLVFARCHDLVALVTPTPSQIWTTEGRLTPYVPKHFSIP